MRKIDSIKVGPSNSNVTIFALKKKYRNPVFTPRRFSQWPDTFDVRLLEDNSLEIRRTDLQVGWGGFLIVDVEFDLDPISIEFIEEWITYTGGVCPTPDNSFGGNPAAKAPLKLKIQQRPAELAEAITFFLDAALRGESMEYYAEIGACSGGTTRAIYEFLLFKEILVIDDGGAEMVQMYVQDREDQMRGVNLGFIPRIEIIGSSTEKRVVEQAVNISKIHLYDILFIDGDHSYECVKADTINYLPIVREGGYIMYHDTKHIHGVMKWMSEIESSGLPLKRVKDIAHKDAYTKSLPSGLGIRIFQKVSP